MVVEHRGGERVVYERATETVTSSRILGTWDAEGWTSTEKRELEVQLIWESSKMAYGAMAVDDHPL